MSTQRIASTPKGHVQSLAFQGIRVTESYHQLVELLRKRRGDSYTLLFAEPSPSADGASIDWYTPVQGKAQKLTELPEEEARKVAHHIGQMGQEIRLLAEELKGTGIQANVVRGHLLELSLSYPDNSYIYAVGGQPVITCWGFGPGTQGARPEDLARIGAGFAAASTPPSTPAAQPGAEPLAPPPPVPPVAPAGTGGCLARLTWLLPLLLLGLLLLLLFVPFGGWKPLITLPGLDFRLPALPGSSQAAPAPDAPSLDTPSLDRLTSEGTALRNDIAQLRRQVDEKAALCVRPPEASAAPLPPITLPEHSGEALSIPEQKDDYGFLEGRWMNDAGLRNKEDGQPITVIYAFDGQGDGSVSVRQKGKQDCVGKAKARFIDEGTLRIETERQVCPNENRAYAAEIIECRPAADGRTSCLGKSASGDNWGGSVYFFRMQ